MSEDVCEDLHARLCKVERRFRAVVTAWTLSTVVFGVLGAWMGQAHSQPSVVRARELQVVDDQGRVRISLGNDPRSDSPGDQAK